MKKKHKKLALVGAAVAAAAGAAYAYFRKQDESHQAVTGFRGLGALDYNVPSQIRNLPFNSRRSELAITAPAYLQAVQEQFVDQPRNPLLPKSMGFTKWKQQPGAGGFGENINALVAAVTYNDGLISEISQSDLRAPTLSQRQVAEPINTLPLSGALLEDPIARGLSQQVNITPWDLEQYSRAAAFIPTPGTIMPSMGLTPAQEAVDYATVWDGRSLRMIPLNVLEG